MSFLFINTLKITCFTDNGKFGCEIPFKKGLNVIRAENSSGKSTCLNTILYALGLEIILGKNGIQALKPAVKTELEYQGNIYKIIESFVELEITNQNSQSITIKRQIVGEQDDRLIIVNKGRELSGINQSSGSSEYYFVRDSGAAIRKKGFHRFLTDFLDLPLPIVETYDGKEVLLYLECIFPSFFIEQRRGWSNLQVTIPNKFRIRDVQKLVTEFILNLDVTENQKIKKEITLWKNKIKSDWQNIHNTLRIYAQEVGGILNGFPSSPTSLIENTENARILMMSNDNQLTLDNWVFDLREKASQLKKSSIETNQNQIDNNVDIKAELKSLETSLLFQEASKKEAIDDFYAEQANRELLISRLASLEEDLVKNRDALKLKKFGADIESSIAEGECPTCHQYIEDSLLEQPKAQIPMTIEKNLEFIKQQRQVVVSLLKKSEEILMLKKANYVNKQEVVANIRQQIQDIKTNLTQNKKLPNIKKIREVINLEEKLKKAITIRNKFETTMKTVEVTCNDWGEMKKVESKLPKDFFSTLDKDKIDSLANLFRENIIKFGFRSENPSSVTLSRYTYRPTIEGFEMVFDASASDNVRLIWAYTIALFELGQKFSTNHFNICFFDEPAQQQVNFDSRKAFYTKLGSFNESGQFITTTSESPSRLSNVLTNVPHTLFEFGDKVLTPIK